jgi:ribonuclease R
VKQKHDHGFPSRDAIVAFIRKNPGNIGTKEIAREFGLKNADRAELKRMLRELSDEGTIVKRGKTIAEAASLPATVLGDITGRDADGELIATPAEWDEAERGEPPKIRVHTPRHASRGTAAGVGDRALFRVERSGNEGIAYRGRVIKVIDHAKHRLLGIFRVRPDGGGRLIPVDKKQAGRELNIAKSDTLGARDGELVSVDLVRSRGYGLALGKVKEKLGSVASEKAISLIAIHAHDIPLEFSKPALLEAEAATPATLKAREDWRNLPLVTIDPPDAKDHDDAVHAEADPNPNNKGGYIVHVAIADVAYYVRPSSALDHDALIRGNSVYFPDRVVPMLPERISNDLCSLVPGEPRGALAVRLVIGPDGRKRSHSFHRVLMRSAAKLNYAQAQAAIDGRPDDETGPLLAPILKPLYAAYDAAKRARAERDPLDLEIPERKILLKPDGTVDRVVVPERLEAHRLIEEFMIAANVAAAEELAAKRAPVIYRVHEPPSQEKLIALREFLSSLELKLPGSAVLRAGDFNRVLERAKALPARELVNEVVLRSQSQAAYAVLNAGHFGLNLSRYSHFTSPIRRYADLIVHRSLIKALGLGAGGIAEEEVQGLGETAALLSDTERRAMAAERETMDRLIAHYLSERVGAAFDARICGVTRAGLFVRLSESGADGFVPAATIGEDYYRHHEDLHALIGDRSGAGYRLGDAVRVRLIEAVPSAGALRFEMLSPAARLAGETGKSRRHRSFVRERRPRAR